MGSSQPAPIFHVEPKGRLGNQMIQYMVALKFRSLVPDAVISNVQFPAWGIDHKPLPLSQPFEFAARQQHVEMDGLVARARAGDSRAIIFTGFGQRMENFLDRDVYRAVFRSPVASPFRFDQRHLICPVRAEDVVDARRGHDYPLTPVEFYQDIVAETGLAPVFMGQTARNPYTERLRAAFPRAPFLETGDPMLDFEIIRQAKNIVLGVTTFGWLAAWLSHAERIFMAVNGLFNPMQCPLVDLLPFGDPRYRFYLFPLNYGVRLADHAAAHQAIAPYWRMVPQPLLQRLFREAPRFDPTMEQMLGAMDAAFYLRTNADVAHAVGPDNAQGALEHYRRHGAREGRQPFRFSASWYAGHYPVAAMEVAQGDYSSLAHHYIAVGRAFGHRPLPDDADHANADVVARERFAGAQEPQIGELSKEVLWLDRPVPLAGDAEVRLGSSFPRWLTGEACEHFRRSGTADAMRAYRLRDVVLDASTMALSISRRPIRETMYLLNQGDYEYTLVKQLHPELTDVTRHYIVGCNMAVNNYYHWMTQSLPAIDWGVRNRRHPQVALALPPLQLWQRNTLALLGHAGVPHLTLNPTTHYWLGSAEYAEFLGERMTRGVSCAAAATFARLREAVVPAPDGSDMLYVARTDATRRVLRNEDALMALLQRQGVRVVVPGALPVAAQLALFRRARLVIGPHGAGLSNIIACEPGAHLYELVPAHYPNACFNRLAQSCRLHYWADAFPADQGEGDAGEGDPHLRGWQVDLDVVAARLADICAVLAAGPAA
jgi:hypothetical protein